jgi:ABC-2 type transport system permease protein
MSPVLLLVWKEYLQVVRDRATLFQIVAIPIIQLLVLANAATFEVRQTRLYVVDEDHSEVSRGLVTRMAASGYFRVVGASSSAERADEAMLSRRAQMVLRVPPRFERELVRTGTAPVQLVMNAEEGAAAAIVRSYAARIVQDYAAELGTRLRPLPAPLADPREAPRPGTSRVEVRARGWYNPELDYRAFMVPGILAALVTIIGTLMTAQNIAREKELGTIEQLNVTPLSRWQFIAGKLLPYWLAALLELAFGLLVAWAVFRIPMRGSLLLVFAVAAVYLVAALGVGLWISTLAETQQQAMFVTFFVLVIYLLMSGLYTPVESMPHALQVAAEFNPVKHFVQIMREVLVKGAGLEAIRRPFAVLVVYAAAVLALAVRQYSKRAG